MSTLHTITLNPTTYVLESRDGTTVSANSFPDVLRVLRTHKRNNRTGELHLLMDRNADVPWTVQAWTINMVDDLVKLQPLEERITPTQRRQGITLRITGYSFGAELGGYKFETFESAIAASRDIAVEPGKPAPNLLITSDFDALDGIEIPAPKVEVPKPAQDEVPDEKPATEIEASDEATQVVTDDANTENDAESSAKQSEATTADTDPKRDADDPELNEHKSERVALAYATRMSTRQKVTAPAHEGFRGWFNKVFKTKLSPSDEERTMRELHALIQRSLSEHRTITMANVKGGAGKSTVDYLIAAILGRYRGGNILYWDNNENSGNIVERAIVPENHEIKAAIDLYNDLHLFENAELSHLLKRYVLMQGDNRFYLLPSQDQAGTKQVIDGEAFNRMYEILRRFYDLMVVDTGNASNSGPWEASIAASDQLIIASSNADDGFRGSLKTIDALKDAGYGEKLANSVVVFTEIIEKKYSKQTTQDYVDQIKDQVREVIVIPFDPELAHGADIVYEALSPATQEAYIRSAAAILGGLN